MIVKEGKHFFVKSEKGRKLGGPYGTREAAEQRLAEIEAFKHMKSKKK
jgi:hypothetical protein